MKKGLKTALMLLLIHQNIHSFPFQCLFKVLLLAHSQNLYHLKIIRNSVDLTLHKTSSPLSLTSNLFLFSVLQFSFVSFGAMNV